MSNLMIGASLTEVLGQTQILSLGSELNQAWNQAANPMFTAIQQNNASLAADQGPSMKPDLQNNNAFTMG